MPIVGVITLYVSLLTFTLRVHPDRLDYVDHVLGACVKKLSGKAKLEDSKATKQVVTLLSAPLEKYNDIVTALTLSNYPRVMDHLDSGTNKVMAMVIIQSIMKNNSCVSTSDKVDVLFELIKGLLKDLDGTPMDELDEEDFKEEQNSVARLIHMLYNEDPEEMPKIICSVRKHFLTGGPKRLPYTVPLVFSALKVSMVSRLKHDNLVELLGYCVKGNIRVLAYAKASRAADADNAGGICRGGISYRLCVGLLSNDAAYICRQSYFATSFCIVWIVLGTCTLGLDSSKVQSIFFFHILVAGSIWWA